MGDTSARGPSDAVLSFLAEHARTRLDSLTDTLVETIERDNPGYRFAGVVDRDDLRRSCHDNIARVLDLLALAVRLGGLGDPVTDPAFAAARETGRRRAEQGLPLDDVLRSFRMGGRLIWDDVVASAAGSLEPAALPEIGTWLWQVVDETSAQVATSYHRSVRAAVRADEQQRAELWEGLLGGRARDPGFALDSARLLDLPASGPVLVVVAADLETVQADQALAPHASAWARRASDVVGLVALREDDPAEATAALQAFAARAGCALGVSSMLTGLSQVHQGYPQAMRALQVQAGRPGVTSFDDRLPEALLLASPDVAGRLVDRWLGPLSVLPEDERVLLLDTLRAWVAAGGSATQAAVLANCHRNTVLNRLHRVEGLVLHELSGEAVLEMDLALRAQALRPT